jgi:hypothetical protein
MSTEGQYRTFVQLEPYERWILRAVQQGIVEAGHRKPPASRLIGGILREYWAEFEKTADPLQLAALKQKCPPP